jgi:phenylpropionate dioxygenase-like ring-hydroxylating dioxygenase large terminal subunit
MYLKQDINHKLLKKAPDPDLGTDLIPHDRYIDPEILKKEFEKLWNKTWLMAGLMSDVRQPGDYFVFEIGRESIIVTRAEDGNIHAFYNVCQHRGNQLKPAGCGAIKSLECPFHRWEWNLDGSVKNIPEAHDFPQGTPHDRLRLPKVKCDTWGGLVWISMDPDIESLMDYLGAVPELLSSYNLENMILVYDETIEWNCNWKTSVDIFSETYHVRGVHPESEYIADDINVQMDLYGPHSRLIAPMYLPSPRRIGPDKALNDIMIAYLKSEGFPVDNYKGDIMGLRQAVADFKRQNSEKTGMDYSNLLDTQLIAFFQHNIFPNIAISFFAEQSWLFRYRPHPTDPDKMYFDRMIFNLPAKGENKVETNAGACDLFVGLGDQGTVESRPEHVSYKWGERSSGLLLDQDSSCLSDVQKGMHSKGFKGLWISFHERRIRNFHKWWEKYMA